jgi:hypothetical protein
MADPEAYQLAMRTGNFESAYKLATDKVKPVISLDEWFSSFLKDSPEDAESLSKGLTKFARYVQSHVDKSKAPV